MKEGIPKRRKSSSANGVAVSILLKILLTPSGKLTPEQKILFSSRHFSLTQGGHCFPTSLGTSHMLKPGVAPVRYWL
jgi:hypothetical protein